MKYTIPYLLAISVLTLPALHAFPTDDDWGSEKITNNLSTDGGGPYNIDLSVDYIGSSKINKKCLEKQHIDFSEAEIDLSSIVYFEPCNFEGISLGVNYNVDNIKWRENPFFDQTRFSTAGVSIAGFSKRLNDWFWRAQVQMNIDTIHCQTENLTWDILVWGRYTYSECIGIHAGFFAWTGIRIDHVWPIFGFDWRIDDQWKLSIVYPVNISLVYFFDCNWSVSIAGRALQNRHRAEDCAILPNAIVEYRNTGGELALNYICGKALEANIHAGYTFGGVLKIANHNNHHSRRFRFNGAPYVGGEVKISF